uniref:Uncharacterized protein n=1 Tax=Cyclophora tenuis TaxID=216820 RepID=A0A7S1DA49_CYCTE
MQRLFIALLALLVVGSSAFVSPAAFVGASRRIEQQVLPSKNVANPLLIPAALQRQRKSVASVQTMGLFGLGPAEIAVILVAGAFLLGPQKLAELGKDAGKIAGELKEVPKEFQKGLEEGEASAKSLKQEMVEDAETE